MCYYLYGSLYGNVSEQDYKKVQSKYNFKISIGTKHDVKLAAKTTEEYVQEDYRITDWICDCDSPVGNHDPDNPMIIELSSLITDLANLSGAKQIYICKTWTGKRNKKEILLKLKDTDLPIFLANIEENCLYCLDL